MVFQKGHNGFRRKKRDILSWQGLARKINDVDTSEKNVGERTET